MGAARGAVIERGPLGRRALPYLLLFQVLLPLQQFVYRQLMYLVVIQSAVTAALGTTLRWHKIERRGDVTMSTPGR